MGLAARHPASLEDALRAALSAARPRCLACGEPVRREPADDGGSRSSCGACGTVLEEAGTGRPQLRLVP